MPELTPTNPEPMLRGTLAPSTSDERSTHLRGTLAPTEDSLEGATGGESRLRGTLTDAARVGLSEVIEEPEPGILAINATVINRDTGIPYRVFKIAEGHRGDIVSLRNDDGERVTLALDDFEEKLKTEGSPWHW
jgi:hypothetical protein